MIELNKLRLLTIQVQDDDIDIFISLFSKLMIISKQIGFKKPFDEYEKNLIFDIGNQLGLNEIEEVKIISEKEQVINKD